MTDVPENAHKLTCGLVMPMSDHDGCTKDHWAEVRQILTDIIESIPGFDFSVRLVSDADDVGVIHKRIVQNLFNADIVVCDVSGKNANVMLELGIRLAFDKPTVIIKDDKTGYSFDTAIIEHIEYPRDLRYPRMVAFRKLLAQKVAATYRTAMEDPNYSTFLRHFSDVPKRQQSPANAVPESPEILAAIANVGEMIVRNIERLRPSGERVEETRASKYYHAVIAPLRLEQFEVHYQPVVEHGKIIALEALARQRAPDGQLIRPAMFIPALEESGKITEFQAWVLDTVLKDHNAWIARGITPPRISINISASQIAQEDFSESFVSRVKSSGARIDVEITESQVLFDPERSIAHLHNLVANGVQIIVDDFGTGYSSLAYLQRLPLSKLKIDRSFIHGLPHKQESVLIVQSVIGLARTFKWRTCAEGVETQEQVATLRIFECDEMQGYLFGKPASADDTAKVMEMLS